MTNIIETLEELNSYSCQGKRNLILRNMIVDEKYPILSAVRHVKKRSGKSVIKLILDKYYIYLPKRFNTLSDNFICEINSNKHYMIQSCGQWKKTYNLVFSNLQTTYDIHDLLNNETYCPVHYASSCVPQNDLQNFNMT